MTVTISIAAAVTVAVTAALIKLLFLSGKTLTNATFFGRLVSRIEPARQAFVDGWRRQSWRYLFICYPSIIVTMAGVSYLLYWLMPALDKTDTIGDMLRYCLLVFAVGVSASLTLTFVLIILVYYLISLVRGWVRPQPPAPYTLQRAENGDGGASGEAAAEGKGAGAEASAGDGAVSPPAPSPDR